MSKGDRVEENVIVSHELESSKNRGGSGPELWITAPRRQSEWYQLMA